MEMAHILVVGESAWISTGSRGEHNRKIAAEVVVIDFDRGEGNGIRFVKTPDLAVGTVVSIEDGSRAGRKARTVIQLPYSKRVGVLIEES